MRKNEFIQLAIKIIGFAILLPSIQTLTSLTFHYVIMIFNSYSDPDAKRMLLMQLISLSPILIRDLVVIIIAGYFLFFGGKASRIIENRVECTNDNQISFPEVALITIRAAGVWFFAKAILILVASIFYPIGRKLARILVFNIYSMGQKEAEATIDFWPNLRMLIFIIIFVLIYITLAIYLLRGGNFFIRFLTKNKGKFSENQISQSQL